MVIELGEMSAPPPVADQRAPRQWLPWVALLLAVVLGGAAIEWASRPSEASFADPVPRWSVVPSGDVETVYRTRVVGDLVIVTGRKALVAYDLTSGAQVWSVPTKGSAPVWTDVLDGILFWGDRVAAGEVRNGPVRQAIDPESGRVLYTIPSSEFESSAVTAAGVARLYMEHGRQALGVLDLRTGAERWRVELPDLMGVVWPDGVIGTWQFESLVGTLVPTSSDPEPDSSTIMVLLLGSGTFQVDLESGARTRLAEESDFYPHWIIQNRVVWIKPRGIIRSGWTYETGPKSMLWGLGTPVLVDGAILDPFSGELIDLETGRASVLPGDGAKPIAMGEGVVARLAGSRVTATRFDGSPGWSVDIGADTPNEFMNDGHRVAIGHNTPAGRRVAVLDLATGTRRDFPGERLLGYGSGLLLVQRGDAVTAYAA